MRLLGISGRLAVSHGARLALLVASVTYCYFDIFSVFASYDDEGFLLITVKEFLEGQPLYDRVYSQYGPAYYLFNYAIFGWGLSINHDAVRLLTIALWSIAASFCALFVHRTTRSFVLATAVYAIVLFDLGALVAEPGHPQGLNTVLITAAVFLSSVRWRLPRLGLVGLGVLAAVVLLVKVNVGVFLILALLLALTTSVRGDRFAAFTGAACSAAALALPTALLWRHLDTTWGAAYASVTSLSFLPILITAWTGPHRSGPVSGERRLGYLWFTAGLFLGITAVLTIALASGVSALGLFQGILIRPLGFSSNYVSPTRFPTHTIVLAACAVALFLGLRTRANRKDTSLRSTRWAENILKLAFVLLVVTFSRRRDAIVLLNYALPLLWVVIVSRRRSDEPTEDFFPRLVLVFVAALQSLQAYPVPGTQLVLGTFLMIPCAALCARDLANEFSERWAVEGGGRWPALAASWLIVAICASFAFRAYRHHQGLVPLDLPGARRLRLPEVDVARYGWMAVNLRAHCDRFITIPGYGSLYFWAQMEPPTALNTTVWWTLLDRREQEEVVAALATAPRACVISLTDPRWLAQVDVGGRPASTLPLARYVLENFETIGGVGRYEFMVRPGRERIDLLNGAIEERSRSRRGDCSTSSRNWTLVTAASPGRILRRVSVIEHVAEARVGDTEDHPGICRIELCDEEGRRLDLSSGRQAEALDLSKSRRLTVRVPAQCELGPPSLLLFRLYDSDGRMLPPLPFMDEPPH